MDLAELSLIFLEFILVVNFDKLIFNVDTTTPIYKPVTYREKMKTMQILDSLKQKQELNTYFSNWFYKNKQQFELYEISKDYYEADNLISNPKYEKIYKTLRQLLFKWIDESDFGNMKESDMLEYMFTNPISVPKLKMPKLVIKDEGIIIESNNQNTSVGWRNKNEKIWNIYTENDLIYPKDNFEILLFRPGYELLIKAF